MMLGWLQAVGVDGLQVLLDGIGRLCCEPVFALPESIVPGFVPAISFRAVRGLFALRGGLAVFGVAGLSAYALYEMLSVKSRDYGFQGTTSRSPIEPAPAKSQVAARPDPAAQDPTPGPDTPVDVQDAPQSVDVTAFAPAELPPGGECFIQIFFHDLRELDRATETAQINEPTADAQISVPLILPLRRNDRLRISLDGDGAHIVGNPVQELEWNERLAYVAFAARFPAHLGERDYRPVARVCVNGAPAAVLRLKIAVTKNAADADPSIAVESARRFTRVFASYSSQDRPDVLRAVQALKALNIQVFIDLLDLRAGQNWEQELRRTIVDCDAFMLFWSTNAKNSEWVIREAAMALAANNASPQRLPEIVPIILEGPPPVPPPPELSHIHFNDPLQSIYFAETQARTGADGPR
jgi:hypothetical protein